MQRLLKFLWMGATLVAVAVVVAACASDTDDQHGHGRSLTNVEVG
jgi:hypothetical protein